AGTNSSQTHTIYTTTAGAPIVIVATGPPAAQFNGNDYWPSNGAFQIRQSGTTYGSLEAWRFTGQEALSGVATGLQVDPDLTDPGGGAAILSIVAKKFLPQYALLAGSPMIDTALDPTAPWATYTPSAIDFFLNPVPVGSKRDLG